MFKSIGLAPLLWASNHSWVALALGAINTSLKAICPSTIPSSSIVPSQSSSTRLWLESSRAPGLMVGSESSQSRSAPHARAQLAASPG